MGSFKLLLFVALETVANGQIHNRQMMEMKKKKGKSVDCDRAQQLRMGFWVREIRIDL